MRPPVLGRNTRGNGKTATSWKVTAQGRKSKSDTGLRRCADALSLGSDHGHTALTAPSDGVATRSQLSGNETVSPRTRAITQVLHELKVLGSEHILRRGNSVATSR